VLGNEDVPCARDHMFPGRGSPARGRGRPLRGVSEASVLVSRSRPSLEVLPVPGELEAIYSNRPRAQGGALADHTAVF